MQHERQENLVIFRAHRAATAAIATTLLATILAACGAPHADNQPKATVQTTQPALNAEPAPGKMPMLNSALVCAKLAHITATSYLGTGAKPMGECDTSSDLLPANLGTRGWADGAKVTVGNTPHIRVYVQVLDGAKTFAYIRDQKVNGKPLITATQKNCTINVMGKPRPCLDFMADSGAIAVDMDGSTLNIFTGKSGADSGAVKITSSIGKAKLREFAAYAGNHIYS